MFILSNDIGIDGAGAIVYNEILEYIRERIGDFYILPSSVNEVLILPKQFGSDDYLKKVVREVNDTVLHNEDWLSDSVYLFDRTVRKI